MNNSATAGEDCSSSVEIFSFVAGAAYPHGAQGNRKGLAANNGGHALNQIDNAIRFDELASAHLADACLRVRVPLRCAPHTMRPAIAGMRASGRARPVRHVGSVDVFLEAIEVADRGDILVVDNDGRFDESCIGDLVVREAALAGLGGIVIWGLHRDNLEVSEIALPMFSLGVTSAGPQRLDDRPPDVFSGAFVGEHRITSDDLVVADSDGVVFLPRDHIDALVVAAAGIREVERNQALAMANGRSLRDQLHFAEYLAQRRRDAGYSFRHHLRRIGGAIEE
jgi:regulator of RNase E activity RraA